MQLALTTAIVTLAALVGTVVSETHTVHLQNEWVALPLSKRISTHL